MPEVDSKSMDAVVFAITFRHLLKDATDLPIPRSDMALARLNSEQEAQLLLDRCVELVGFKVGEVSNAFAGLPVFFMSFPEPGFDYVGEALNPYRRQSPRAFMRRLNERLAELVSATPNGHLLECNEILNFVGRMHLQDDVLHASSHLSYITDWDLTLDLSRMVPAEPNVGIFEYDKLCLDYGEVVWRTVANRLKIIKQARPVKLVIVDLDDTLWRGLAAEETMSPWDRTEGWPMGFVESLLFFKQRGGLLAICSKNDEVPTLKRMEEFWKGAIAPEDFVSIKINWRPKSENVAEILEETNLLPANTLFIDDNPREIDEVRSRFGDLRCLGGRHYDWRRIILRSAETQVPVITAESQNRTGLVRALVDRQQLAKSMPRDEWLRSLDLEQYVFTVRDTSDAHFERVFELINKTNQFNTNGKRWTLGEITEFFRAGGVCIGTSLKDKTADNGIIGVSLVANGEIVQSVLSCRVFGLGAEKVMGRFATLIALGQKPEATARIVDTGKNFACHSFFENIGFTRRGDHFAAAAACATPEWIKVTQV
ncbi:MAG: HAD-IIIC family phosphatase [Myxococcaceae bacterium]